MAKKKKKKEYASVGGRPGDLPSSGDGNLLGNQTSGFKKGDTPALNTAILRHGRKAVKRAINNARRGR